MRDLNKEKLFNFWRLARFWVSLLLFALIFPISLFGEMTDKEFFDSINQDYPGLESMKAALLAQDTSTAKIELLHYFQQPRSVHYFELSGSGSVSQADDNLNHYFTVVGIRKFAGASDGTIDWTTHDEVDREWHFQFHRMQWIVNLGKVYRSTQNEKYAREWIAELIDWAHDNSPGYPRTLDTGIRLRNWVESYQYFVCQCASPSISAEDHATVLKSIMEQARFLRSNWRNQGNWGANETRGLGCAVIMFPEFKFTPDDQWEAWRDLVLERLRHHLSNDFYADGVQYETSPYYHSLEYRNLFLTYKLLSLNNISVSSELINLFVKPLEFMMYIHKPDGFLPQLSDTDRKSLLGYLKEGASLFQRPDMMYVATKGSQGIAPAATFVAFPQGGYVVMRSDWGEGNLRFENAKYLVFDVGENEPWHAHFDILNFVVYANNSTLVRDAGRYTYVAGQWRDYFKGTAAHNTIVIDHQNQSAEARGELLEYETMPGMDFVAGRLSNYVGVTHERSIIFLNAQYWLILDRVTGAGSHLYELLFHLDSPYLGYVTLNSSSKAAITPNFTIVPSDSTLAAEIDSGWISNSYNSKSAAPVIKYQQNGTPPVFFETLIFPFDSQNSTVTMEKKPVYDGNSAPILDAFLLQINFENKRDWIFYSSNHSDSLNTSNFSFRAKIAALRREADNSFSSIHLYQGDFFAIQDTLLVDCDPPVEYLSLFQHCIWAKGENISYFKIWAPQTDSVFVNGKAVNFSQQGNYVIYSPTRVSDKNNLKASIIEQFELGQNYPNPFNQRTSISVRLSRSEKVELDIFNLKGQKVKRLLNAKLPKGTHKIFWDGTDSTGEPLSSGIYLYCLKIANRTIARRAILMK